MFTTPVQRRQRQKEPCGSLAGQAELINCRCSERPYLKNKVESD